MTSDGRRKAPGRGGQTLIEVLVATAVLIIGVYGIMAIFAPGMKTGRAMKIRAAAAQLAEAEERRSSLMYQYPEAIVTRMYSYDDDGDPIYEPLDPLPAPFQRLAECKWNITPDHTRINSDYLRFVKDVIGETFVARNAPAGDLNYGIYVVSYAPVVAASEVLCFAKPYRQYERDAEGWPAAPEDQVAAQVDDTVLREDSWACMVDYAPNEARIYFDRYQHPWGKDTRRFSISYSYVDDEVVHDVVGELYDLADNEDIDPPGRLSLPLGATGDYGPAPNVIRGSITIYRVVENWDRVCYNAQDTADPTDDTWDLVAYPDPPFGAGRTTGAGVLLYSFRGAQETPNQVAMAYPGDLLRVDYTRRGKNQRLALYDDILYYEIPDILQHEGTLPRPEAAGDFLAALPTGVISPEPLGDEQNNEDVQDTTAVINLSSGEVARSVDDFAAGTRVRTLYRADRGWALQPVLSAARYAIAGPADPGDPPPWLAPGAVYRDGGWAPRFDYSCIFHPQVTRDEPGLCPLSPPAPNQHYLSLNGDGFTKQWWLQVLPPDAGNRTRLLMPAGRTLYKGAGVAVDYVYEDAQGIPHTVYGEVHVLGPILGRQIGLRLEQERVTEVRAVHGVSVYVRSFWRDPLDNWVLLSTPTGTQVAGRVFATTQVDSAAVREGLVR